MTPVEPWNGFDRDSSNFIPRYFKPSVKVFSHSERESMSAFIEANTSLDKDDSSPWSKRSTRFSLKSPTGATLVGASISSSTRICSSSTRICAASRIWSSRLGSGITSTSLPMGMMSGSSAVPACCSLRSIAINNIPFCHVALESSLRHSLHQGQGNLLV